MLAKSRANAFLLVVLSTLYKYALAGNGELFDEKGQKNYEPEEEGKIIPHRYETS